MSRKLNLIISLTGFLGTPGCFTPNLAAEADTEDEGGATSTSTSEVSTMSGTAATSESGGRSTGIDETGTDKPTTGDTTSGDPPSTSTGATTTDSEGTSTSTGERPVACGAGAVCLPPAEDGWLGPVAYYVTDVGAPPHDCSSGVFSSTDLEAVEAPAADDAECGCSCGEAQNLTHAGETTLHYYGGSAVCSPANQDWEVSFTEDDFCQVLTESTPTTGIHRFAADAVAITGGSCEPSADVVLPRVAAGDEVRLCGEPDAVVGICEEGEDCTALPQGIGVDVCIWRPGDHECPPVYGDKHTVFGGFEDSRTCSACGCGAPEGTINAEVEFYDHSSCLFPSAGTMAVDGVCVNPSGDGDRRSANVSFTSASDDAECAPIVGTPTGGVQGTNPATVCCAG